MKAYLDEIDQERLEAAARNQRDRLLVRLLIQTGCRISEELGLRVGDVDFVQFTIQIQHLKKRIGLTCSKCAARLGKVHKFCPKCGVPVSDACRKEKDVRRYRTIPVDQTTLQILKEYLASCSPAGSNADRLIFGLNRHRAWQIVRDCADRARLPKLTNPESGKVHNVSPHRLRDAFAVHAMKVDDSGEGMRLLQEHLGHASFNTTARYRKIAGEERQAWNKRLWNRRENDLGKPCEKQVE